MENPNQPNQPNPNNESFFGVTRGELEIRDDENPRHDIVKRVKKILSQIDQISVLLTEIAAIYDVDGQEERAAVIMILVQVLAEYRQGFCNVFYQIS